MDIIDIIDKYGYKTEKNQKKALLLKEQVKKFKYVSITDIVGILANLRSKRRRTKCAFGEGQGR